MNDNEILNCVNIASNQIKKINYMINETNKLKNNDLQKIDHDIELSKKHVKYFEEGTLSLINLYGFKSVKVQSSIPDNYINKEVLLSWTTQFEKMREDISKVYDHKIKVIKDAHEKYIQNLKDNNIDIFHHVADTMVNVFNL